MQKSKYNNNLCILFGILGILLILPMGLIAAPTDLDPSFDEDGKVFLTLGGDGDFLKGMGLTSNGKIVLGGHVKAPNRFFDYPPSTRRSTR